MLKFILKETGVEEKEAHEAENRAQHLYEDSMQSLKDDEKDMQDSLATLNEELTEAEELRAKKSEDKKTTEDEKAALVEALKQLKPGCDFITENIDERKANRVTE